MAVLLIPNALKDQGLTVTRRAAELLQQFGVPVLMTDTDANARGIPHVTVLPEAEAYSRQIRY